MPVVTVPNVEMAALGIQIKLCEAIMRMIEASMEAQTNGTERGMLIARAHGLFYEAMNTYGKLGKSLGVEF